MSSQDDERASQARGAAMGWIERHAGRIALGLVALQLALLVHLAQRVGPTYDEHFYVAAGHAYLRDGDFALNREHPPLVKYLVGAPLFLLDLDWPERWRDLIAYPATFVYQQNAEHVDAIFFLARLPLCLLMAGLSWLVFRSARRLFGAVPGLVALLLVGFNPNMLAQGPLAGLDSGLTVFLFVAVLSFAELLARPSWSRALAAAVGFGLANLAKFTSLVLGPVFLVGALGACLLRRSLAPAGWTALVLLGGLGVFVAGYGFEARSLNEAWGEAPYRTSVRPSDRWNPSPAELAEVAREEGMQAAIADQLAREPDLDRAAQSLLQMLGTSDEQVRAHALETIERLSAGAGEVRKRAFVAVLHAPGLDEERRAEVLSALAGVQQPDRAAWLGYWARQRYANWDRALLTQPIIEGLVRALFGDARPVPLFSAIKGVDYQLHHGSSGHTSYYRGRTLDAIDFAREHPAPWYYLDVLWLKHPLPWTLLVALGVLLSLRARGAWTWAHVYCFLGVSAALMYVFSSGKALMGVRYVLPVLPLIGLCGARVACVAPRLALSLAAASALLGLLHHPHQLMYYNLAVGGSRGGPELTVTSDDWGQGIRELGRFVEEHRDAIEEAGGLHYEPYFVGDPAAFGLRELQAVRPDVRGIVAVNAVSYWRDLASGTARKRPRKFAWLDAYEPFRVIDESIYVYDTRVAAPGGDPLEAWESR